MTEKRFVDYFDKDHNYIIQDLQNEDEYQVGFVNCDEDVFLKLVNKIADENKQLKQFKEKVFTLIDKEIARNEEAIEWGKETGADSGSIGFYNHMLNRLKKELQE